MAVAIFNSEGEIAGAQCITPTHRNFDQNQIETFLISV
jgi:hypothetical protein